MEQDYISKIAEFFNQGRITGIVILLLLLSIICQIMIGVLYQNMIKEADNMAATENRLLKQCKLKFINCYQTNMGVTNIPVFVDKFLNKIRLGGMSLIGIGHLSGQLMLISVFVSGIGICKGIVEGRTIGSLLPYYIVSLFGLYAYFSVSSLVDLNGKKRILKTNLVDYLENHMINHLSLVSGQAVELGAEAGGAEKEALAAEDGRERKRETRSPKSVFSKSEEQELGELLKEFLSASGS